PDHAALRAVAAGGVEIRRRQLRARDVRLAADLCRVLRHHRLHGAVPRGGALSAQAAAAGVGRLLQESERHGLYLSDVMRWGRAPPVARSSLIRTAGLWPASYDAPLEWRAPSSPVGQRDELRVARYLGEAAVAPVGLGLLDALLRRRYEIPPDV